MGNKARGVMRSLVQNKLNYSFIISIFITLIFSTEAFCSDEKPKKSLDYYSYKWPTDKNADYYIGLYSLNGKDVPFKTALTQVYSPKKITLKALYSIKGENEISHKYKGSQIKLSKFDVYKKLTTNEAKNKFIKSQLSAQPREVNAHFYQVESVKTPKKTSERKYYKGYGYHGTLIKLGSGGGSFSLASSTETDTNFDYSYENNHTSLNAELSALFFKGHNKDLSFTLNYESTAFDITDEFDLTSSLKFTDTSGQFNYILVSNGLLSEKSFSIGLASYSASVIDGYEIDILDNNIVHFKQMDSLYIELLTKLSSSTGFGKFSFQLSVAPYYSEYSGISYGSILGYEYSLFDGLLGFYTEADYKDSSLTYKSECDQDNLECGEESTFETSKMFFVFGLSSSF
jgi:hypothetical protein